MAFLMDGGNLKPVAEFPANRGRYSLLTSEACRLLYLST